MEVKNIELVPLFEELKGFLVKYENYFDLIEKQGEYHLVYKGKVIIGDREREEVYFVSLMIQRKFVGLYFMPQYTIPETKPEYYCGVKMIKTLKGKSCYNIYQKDYIEEYKGELSKALEKGFVEYKKRGWVK